MKIFILNILFLIGATAFAQDCTIVPKQKVTVVIYQSMVDTTKYGIYFTTDSVSDHADFVEPMTRLRGTFCFKATVPEFLMEKNIDFYLKE